MPLALVLVKVHFPQSRYGALILRGLAYEQGRRYVLVDVGGQGDGFVVVAEFAGNEVGEPVL